MSVGAFCQRRFIELGNMSDPNERYLREVKRALGRWSPPRGDPFDDPCEPGRCVAGAPTDTSARFCIKCGAYYNPPYSPSTTLFLASLLAAAVYVCIGILGIAIALALVSS